MKTERTARIIHSFRKEFPLKEILAVLKFPKSTYMYWQKRFERESPDQKLEDTILKIREKHEERIKERLGWKSPIQYRLSKAA